jgi:hypothetical protein
LHLKTFPPIMCMGDPSISKVHCDLYRNFAQSARPEIAEHI